MTSDLYGWGRYGEQPYGRDPLPAGDIQHVTPAAPSESAPVARPIVGQLTERLYEMLGPTLTGPDPEHGWALLQLVDALAAPAATVDDVIRDKIDPDTDEVRGGWADLFAVDRTPAAALPTLGAFAGVDVSLAEALADPQGTRTLIRERPGRARGTMDALVSAARSGLSGTRRVDVLERRGGSPWRFSVRVYRSEAVNLAAVHRAVQRQKPVGYLVDVEAFPGQTVADLRAAHASVQEVKDLYADCLAVKTAVPGTQPVAPPLYPAPGLYPSPTLFPR